jgi:hypothetical protein
LELLKERSESIGRKNTRKDKWIYRESCWRF